MSISSRIQKVQKVDPVHHYSNRSGWLRAAVLGSNDGIVSVASLMMGVAASGVNTHVILVTGIAGLVSGALSMAAGEYVSVQSQSDIEKSDLINEKKSLSNNPDYELDELTKIYVQRGLSQDLAHQVAVALTAQDALKAHAQDEIGISKSSQPHPIQASASSALSFVLGAALPLIAAWLSPASHVQFVVAICSVLALMISGALSSYAGGVPWYKGMLRVTIGGLFAMLVTTWIGSLFGANLG
jgi:VIT1/CCC1 family predicted Fe2+/Mn2+ transporter